MTSTARSPGKRPDLFTEWSDWAWSDELGCNYSYRYGPDGEVEYEYAYEECEQEPRYTGELPAIDTPSSPKIPPHYTTSATPTSIDRLVHTTTPPNLPVLGTESEQANKGREAEIDQSTEDTYDGFQLIAKPTRFFKIGRVFKTFWSEPAGENSATESANITTLPQGGNIFTQMRYFVVVREMKGCCICLSLFTYNGQGTTKKGIQPQDYAAVHSSSDSVCILPGENLSKEPFPIFVENLSESIDPMSRLNFGRIYTVEHNVKVLKVGRIPDEHHARLNRYLVRTVFGPNWKDVSTEMTSNTLDLTSGGSLPASNGYTVAALPYSRVKTTSTRLPTYLNSSSSATMSLDPAPSSPMVQVQAPNGRIAMARHITKSGSHDLLNERFVIINGKKGKKFWKPGRVFMMLWTEPARGAEDSSDSRHSTVWLGQSVFSEIRRFVVIGEGYDNAICSPIHTYSGRATLKANLNDVNQHAIIYTSSKPPPELCEYDEGGNVVRQENLTKAPIRVIREESQDDGDLGGLARLNYAKIYTVEKYVRIRNIGRVHEDSMDELLSSCFFARPKDQPPQGPRKAKPSDHRRKRDWDKGADYKRNDEGQSSKTI